MHPDIAIVLLDLAMPVKGGWDTFERLAASNPRLPVIIITAQSDQNSVALRAGVAALIEKPLDMPALLAPMQGVFAESSERRLARLTRSSVRSRQERPRNPENSQRFRS